MVKPTLALSLLSILLISGCGGNMAAFTVQQQDAPQVTIKAADVFTPHVGDVWTFRNNYGDTTKITWEAVPASNYLPAGSITSHYTKDACRAYWLENVCGAEILFVLSPQSDGSWISKMSLFNFPDQIPDWNPAGVRVSSSDYEAVPGMPTPYLIVPVSGQTGKVDSVVTAYRRWDEMNTFDYDSIVSGSPAAEVTWRTDSYVENVSTPVYSGPALVSEQWEGPCTHEKWYFAPGHGLVKVIPLDQGNCAGADLNLTMLRID